MSIQKIFLRAPYNYDVDKVSDETGLKCEDDSLTIQSSKDESDINVIVDRFTKTGTMPQLMMPPLNADFDAVFDFQDAMNLTRAAKESFDAMPAKVRTRFNNDPAAFVDFCSDQDNIDEMRKLGLAPVKEVNTNVSGFDQDVRAPVKPPGEATAGDKVSA